MKTVLLAGGLGSRLREETDIRPKPMIEVGGHPILWHIMKTYANFGHDDFIICAGYKAEVIRNWLINFRALSSDFTIKFNCPENITFHSNLDELNWSVTLADTGQNTMTGGRIKMVRDYLDDQPFFCTYGDGVADININQLQKFHEGHGKIATLTTVKPISRFGVLDLGSNSQVNSFREKPQSDGSINAGYFVFNPEIFNYLEDNSVLEEAPLRTLAANQQLMAFQHEGFWQPMDTYRELMILNKFWDSGNAPWKVWNK